MPSEEAAPPATGEKPEPDETEEKQP